MTPNNGSEENHENSFNLKCPYHAKVMNILDAISNKTVYNPDIAVLIKIAANLM